MIISFRHFIAENEGEKSETHKEKIAASLRGRSKPTVVKKKISQAMKGTSNFAGQSHTSDSKKIIGDKRGKRDPIQNKKWIVNRFTKETLRKNSNPSQAWLWKRRVVRKGEG